MNRLVLPSSFQSVIGMGDPIQIYKQNWLSKSLNIIGSAMFLFAGLYIGYYGFVVYPREAPNVAQTNSPFIIGFGGLLLLAGLYWAWRVASRWNDAAVIYRDGFAHFNGKEVMMFRWDEISLLTMRVVQVRYYGVIPGGTERKYTITGQSGNHLKLDGTLTRIGELFDQIREKTFPYLIAKSLQAFNAGQHVQFGPISISKSQGIQKGDKYYAWNDIDKIGIDSGTVVIRPKNKGLFGGFSVPVANIPNVDVFLTLAIETMRQTHSLQPSS